jgi:hypothetical protein
MEPVSAAVKQKQHKCISRKLGGMDSNEIRTPGKSTADRNHRISFIGRPNSNELVFANSLYDLQISFNAGTHKRCGFGHKVKLAAYWNQ